MKNMNFIDRFILNQVESTVFRTVLDRAFYFKCLFTNLVLEYNCNSNSMLVSKNCVDRRKLFEFCFEVNKTQIIVTHHM